MVAVPTAAATAAAALTAAALSVAGPKPWWQPSTGTTFFIDLSQPLNTSYAPTTTAIDGDLFANPASTWAALEAAGHKTICYFSAGSFEAWRPDAGQFNRSGDLGKPLQGWPGEWWLDTNSGNVRRIMAARIAMAATSGCDAVDPDNVDAYDNDNGLGLTQADAIDYIQFLADQAHAQGMAVGLKNALEIIPAVQPLVDFAVNEQCLQYHECDQAYPFVQNETMHKPVFEIEYQGSIESICASPARQTFSTVLKHMSLDAWYEACATNQSAVDAAAANGTVAGDSSVSSSSSSGQTSDAGRPPMSASKVAALVAVIGLSVLL